MKNAIILSLISILLLTSCADDDLYVGEGEIITKELTLNDFNAIKAIGSYDIIISKGATQKVEVTAHSNIIERLETHVYNNIWGIELRDGNYRNSDLTIHISLPTLNKAMLEGSGEIIVNDFSSDEDAFFGIYGSGDIHFYNNNGCKNLSLEIDGSGNIFSNNQFENLENINLKIIGSGNYNGFENNTQNAIIDIEGSGDCNISINKILNVKIDGSGTINYKGNPISIESNIKGPGKIIDNN